LSTVTAKCAKLFEDSPLQISRNTTYASLITWLVISKCGTISRRNRSCYTTMEQPAGLD